MRHRMVSAEEGHVWNTFLLYQLDTCKKLSLDTFVCFAHFQKAYDKVNRSLLLQKLQSLGLEADFVQIIAALYSANTSCVHVNGKLSSWL